MERKMKYLAAAATLISVLLLVVFIVYSDDIAEKLSGGETYGENKKEEWTESMSGAASQTGLYVETEPMIYNGSTPFIIMNGVTAADIDGSDMTAKVSASVTDGSIPSKKVIRYQFFDSAGVLWSAERPLVLEDYSGPILEIENNLTLHAEDLENLVMNLASDGKIKAENGYGESILYNVNFNIDKGDSSGYYNLKFEAYNEFNDAVSQEISAFIPDMLDHPMIVLSTHSITLKKGESFSSLDYIAMANDPEDGDISSNIQIEGYVDTTKTGVYLLKYTAEDSEGNKSNTETLTITVED